MSACSCFGHAQPPWDLFEQILSFFCKHNKTENAFSPLPARTKAAWPPLQDCIVQTTRLPAYGRKCLLPRCSPANKATGLWPDNFAPLHGSCPAAVAVSQTAYKRSAVTCSGRIPNCIHAVAVALLQWQDTKLHARMAALLHWQVVKLLY
jgi:hypothetical protein